MELNKIYNEDCLLGMQRIPDGSIDMILCGLPYGTTHCHWDKLIPIDQLFNQYLRIIKDKGAIVLTAQQPFATDLINGCRKYFRYEIIWEKSRALGFLAAKKMPLRSHENILIFYKKLPTYNPQKTKAKTRIIKRKGGTCTSLYGSYKIKDYIDDGTRYPTSVLKIQSQNAPKLNNVVKNPTMKPVALFEWLIRTYTNEGEVVVDSCIGSGTTAVACLNSGRNYVGFELNDAHYKLIMKRIENHKRKMFI